MTPIGEPIPEFSSKDEEDAREIEIIRSAVAIQAAMPDIEKIMTLLEASVDREVSEALSGEGLETSRSLALWARKDAYTRVRRALTSRVKIAQITGDRSPDMMEEKNAT